jgi:hypothetical protein
MKHIDEVQNYRWGHTQASNKRAFSFKTGCEPSHSSFSSFLSHARNITGPKVDGTCSYNMLKELHSSGMLLLRFYIDTIGKGPGLVQDCQAKHT